MNTLALALTSHADRHTATVLARKFADVPPPGAHRTARLKELVTETGLPYGTLLRKFYSFQRAGVLGLVNARTHPDLVREKSAITPETQEFFATLCIENQRKHRPAWRALCRMFFAGEDIPGLPPGTPREELPAGWSETTFRQFAPTRFEATSARLGLRAASAFRPLVATTRSQMRFFEELQVDDVWHDVQCVMMGQRQVVRPLQLGVMDVFSACLVQELIKPRVTLEDGSRTNLDANDMVYLFAGLLGQYGHHPAGTTFNCESGTAAPPDALIDLVHRLSGGAVKFRVGKANNFSAMLGSFPGVGKGNFRLRAVIESYHNIAHNETANRMLLDAQTGLNSRTAQPEDLEGRTKEMRLVLAAVPYLPEWVVKNLRKPMPEWHEALRAIQEVNALINRRTQHDCEGFVEAGLVETEFTLPNLGTLSREDFEGRLARIPDPAQREMFQAMAEPRARKLSPWEVAQQRRGELHRWKPHELALLLYLARREGVVRVRQDHLVVIQDAELAPGKLLFDASRHAPGEEFECAINPAVPDLLFLYDARAAHRGAWRGVLRSIHRAPRTDTEAMAAAIKESESTKHLLLARVKQLGSRLAERRLRVGESGIEELREVVAEMETALVNHDTPPPRPADDCTSDLLQREIIPAETAVETWD